MATKALRNGALVCLSQLTPAAPPLSHHNPNTPGSCSICKALLALEEILFAWNPVAVHKQQSFSSFMSHITFHLYQALKILSQAPLILMWSWYTTPPLFYILHSIYH